MLYLRQTDVLLFQGDSITHGGRGENQNDLNHVIGHGYQAALTGRILYENRDRMPTILNRGVSGDTTGALLRRWGRDALSLRPTALSLLIGVNNCLKPQPDPPAVYASELRELLERILAACPGVRLILGEPFAFLSSSDGDAEARQREALVAAAAETARSLAAEYGAVFVPFWEELRRFADACPPGTVVWDGVHPTVLGHEIMARLWYRTVDAAGIFPEPEN